MAFRKPEGSICFGIGLIIEPSMYEPPLPGIREQCHLVVGASQPLDDTCHSTPSTAYAQAWCLLNKDREGGLVIPLPYPARLYPFTGDRLLSPRDGHCAALEPHARFRLEALPQA